MFSVEVEKGYKLYVDFEKDTFPNKGGFYCRVYGDREGEFELDGITILKNNVVGSTDEIRLERAKKYITFKLKELYKKER